MKNIGVLIYTHNRIDDAKINMEIIRNVWESSEYFDDVKIVHTFNGEKSWYPKKYLENDLIRIKNTWHFQGASDLIDAGIKAFKKYKDIDYVIVLASDTWLIKPKYVENILSEMKKEKSHLATCPWGLVERNEFKDVGMATDFFIVDLKWVIENKMFPVRYGEFHKKYKDLFLYQNGGDIMLEKLALARFIEVIGREQDFNGSASKVAFENIFRLKDREPVHDHIDREGNWIRNMYWQKMGLLTHHESHSKKIILNEENIKEGECIEKLLKMDDLTYFNNGTTKSKLSSN